MDPTQKSSPARAPSGAKKSLLTSCGKCKVKTSRADNKITKAEQVTPFAQKNEQNNQILNSETYFCSLSIGGLLD